MHYFSVEKSWNLEFSAWEVLENSVEMCVLYIAEHSRTCVVCLLMAGCIT